jgi:Leucine-rich repeat (LRR) protein
VKFDNLFLSINYFKKPKFFEFKYYLKYFFKRKKFNIKFFSLKKKKNFFKPSFLRFILLKFLKLILLFNLNNKIKYKKHKKVISYYLWPFYKINESVFFSNYMFKNIINLFFF